MVSSALTGIGNRWREKIAVSPDYVVIPHDNRFRMGMNSSAIGESSFKTLGDLLARLLSENEGLSIEKCLGGYESSNEEGDFYYIDSHLPCTIPSIQQDRIRHSLFSELRLVYGIGIKKRDVLKRKGCRSIPDLQYQRRYASDAGSCIRDIDSGPSHAGSLIRSRLGPSHPLHLMVSGQYDPSRFRFIDIETLGIFGRPIILFGIGFLIGEELCIRQILVRDISEELPALVEVQKLLGDDPVIISYNGKCFDIPYISERFGYYALPGIPDSVHYDLLHFVRRFWKHSVYDCRLSTIESRFLGVKRDVDIPGMLVPEWYSIYQETGNPGPVIPIVEHNRQDVASLALLFSSLREMADECC